MSMPGEADAAYTVTSLATCTGHASYSVSLSANVPFPRKQFFRNQVSPFLLKRSSHTRQKTCPRIWRSVEIAISESIRIGESPPWVSRRILYAAFDKKWLSHNSIPVVPHNLQVPITLIKRAFYQNQDLVKCAGLEFNPSLGANPSLKRMLYFGHLGHQVGGFDQFFGSVAAGDHDV